MKRLFGALLMLGGALSLYFFTSRVMFHGRASLGGDYSAKLPFSLVGMDYPYDALLLAGAWWGLLLGLYHTLTGSEEIGRLLKSGRVARIGLLNALLLVSSLLIAWVGARHGKDAVTVAVFALVAAAQVVLGLILLVLSFLERPKGWVSLTLGGLVYAGGVTLAALAYLGGS
jgi:hypothetical protein